MYRTGGLRGTERIFLYVWMVSVLSEARDLGIYFDRFAKSLCDEIGLLSNMERMERCLLRAR